MARQRVVCGKVSFEPVERFSRLRRAPSDCWPFDSDGEFSSCSETLLRRRRTPIARVYAAWPGLWITIPIDVVT